MKCIEQILGKAPILILFPLLMTLSCSSIPIERIPNTHNPSTEIEKLERGLFEAQNQQISILSPQYFRDAKEALREAKKSRAEDKKNEVILDYVAIGQGNLKLAKERSLVAAAALESVLAAREAAMTADAPLLAEADFKDADTALMEVTGAIEHNNLTPAEKHKTELIQTYSQLELQAIKEKQLSEARQLFFMAEREGAKKYAPVSYKEFELQLKAADRSISEHRHDQHIINSLGAATLAGARHLLDVTRKSKFLNRQDAESLVLNEEKQAQSIQELRNAAELEARRLSQVQEESRILGAANKHLRAHQHLDATLEQAKRLFTEKEAEVYRDGERLVIRLKQLAFPLGKATIPLAALPLLTKVNETLRVLGKDSSIEIQGHTDSLGDVTSNQKLSEERALAVKSYLIAKGIDERNIKTVGFGQTKPIAINKTEEGRAQNRRVDIIIEPKIPLS